MTISLTSEQQAWLKAQVDRGEFRSIDEAARQLIDERIAERAAEGNDDLAWAKSDVDDALAEVSRGRVMTLAEHEARITDLLASMKA